MTNQNRSRGHNICNPNDLYANEQVKMWTDNKFYLQASALDISTKFSNNNHFEESLTKYKEFSNTAFKVIPEDNKLEYFKEYRQNLVNNYFRDSNNVKKESFEKLKKILLEVSSNEHDMNEKIKDLKYDDVNNRVDPEIYKFCNNYKYTIFRGISLKSFSTNDRQRLQVYLEEYEKQRKNHYINGSAGTNPPFNQVNNQVMNNQNNIVYDRQFDEFLNNLSKNMKLNDNSQNHNQVIINNVNSNAYNYDNNKKAVISKQNKDYNIDLIDLDDFPKVSTNLKRPSDFAKQSNLSDDRHGSINPTNSSLSSNNKKIYPYCNNSEEIQEERCIKNILMDDFRMAVGDKGINENICMSYLISSNNNIMEAANLYFQDRFGSHSLKITYILPDNKEMNLEFSFMASSDDLFLPLYSNPNINNPEIYMGHRKIEINPLTEKYIGNLNIMNNSRLVVKSE